MVGMVGVLGKGLVTGILYGFDIDNEGNAEISHSFKTDYSKRCISCSCIGMGLVTYYIGLFMILEGYMVL